MFPCRNHTLVKCFCCAAEAFLASWVQKVGAKKMLTVWQNWQTLEKYVCATNVSGNTFLLFAKAKFYHFSLNHQWNFREIGKENRERHYLDDDEDSGLFLKCALLNLR